MNDRARSTLGDRLAAATGDPVLAAALVDRWDDATVDAVSTAGDAAVSFVPSVIDGDVDAVLAFAFGNRATADGGTTPGPVNAELAATALALADELDVPVFAQWEIADEMPAGAARALVSIGPDVDDDGEVVYLSTAGVAEKAARIAAADGRPLRRVAVVAFADHAVRCVLTARSVGLDAGVVDAAALPSAYDTESGQPWTRDRLSYLAVDVPHGYRSSDGAEQPSA